MTHKSYRTCMYDSHPSWDPISNMLVYRSTMSWQRKETAWALVLLLACPGQNSHILAVSIGLRKPERKTGFNNFDTICYPFFFFFPEESVKLSFLPIILYLGDTKGEGESVVGKKKYQILNCTKMFLCLFWSEGLNNSVQRVWVEFICPTLSFPILEVAVSAELNFRK